MGVTAVVTLVLAAVVRERREGEERLRLLAVSDPLTGLANYRKLTDALEAEVRRSSRTDRPFAVVLLDLDGLKKVNDRHGHLVGSRALCRVAEVLHGSCRGVDTAARFGGDEFAVVLPETGEDAAWLVARRRPAPVACGAMATVERPRRGSLTVGPLRPVILGLAAPAVAMMACHFSFNLIDSIWVGRPSSPPRG